MTPSQGDLRVGFAAFIEASQRLEQSYAELRERAAAIDEQLQATNLRLQQALAERDAIFAALPLGVVARRNDGSVQFQNDEARRLCGLGRGVGVDLLAAPAGEVELGAAGVRVRCADLPDGELVLLEDRSRIKELEREVHRLDRLAGLSELALGIAHEIKNPLNGAMGFAELLARAPSGENAQRHAERIRRALRQVDEIVKSLLGFARPDGRPAEARPVAEVIAHAAAAVGLPTARIVLGGPGTLAVAGAALQRVLAVLFRNAIEAKGEDVTLCIQVRAIGPRVELVVEDDGPGVAAELGARVFEPFVSTKERGTGLGLPLAARVLSFLGGELSLLNPGEPGARFRVRLPLAGPNAQPTGAQPDGPSPARAEGSA